MCLSPVVKQLKMWGQAQLGRSGGSGGHASPRGCGRKAGLPSLRVSRLPPDSLSSPSAVVSTSRCGIDRAKGNELRGADGL